MMAVCEFLLISEELHSIGEKTKFEIVLLEQSKTDLQIIKSMLYLSETQVVNTVYCTCT